MWSSKGLSVVLLLLALGSGHALAQPVATPVWSSGFEKGFPGEFLDYNDGSYSPSGQPTSATQTWAIVDASQDAPIFAGEHVYKGWLHGTSADSHRAYPVIHVDFPTPLVNSFMVYLDVDYAQMADEDWIHFGTWGNDADWTVHTMAVRMKKLGFAHVEDEEYIGPSPQPDFPLRRWVRLTVYLHYRPEGDGTVVAWQDGVPILRGRFTDMVGQNLMRAHWGMYANGATSQGVQYNDEIQIWTLSEPLTDFDVEPESPYDSDPNPPMSTAGTGGGGRGSMESAGQGGRGNPRGGAGGASSGGRAGSGGGSATGTAGGRSQVPPTAPMNGIGGSTSASPGSGMPEAMPGAGKDQSIEGSGCAAAPGAAGSTRSLSLLALGGALLALRGRRKRS